MWNLITRVLSPSRVTVLTLETYSSHFSTTQRSDVCAALSSALLTHGAILKSKITWRGYRSVSWTRRVAAEGPDCRTGGIAAILTHTLSPLTEVQRSPWLSAFPKPLAQIPAWPRLINYAMDRSVESFSFKTRVRTQFPQHLFALWGTLVHVVSHETHTECLFSMNSLSAIISIIFIQIDIISHNIW